METDTTSSGYEMRKCSYCDFEFVGSDDARMYRHLVSEHAGELSRAWQFGRVESQRD